MATQKTIVVADDDRDSVAGVRATLEPEGFRVLSTSNGPELFTVLASEQPDLIILELAIPGMDGFDVLLKLKDNPHYATIPVIILTSKRGYADAIKGYQLGADYYVTKPFTEGHLITGINLFLHDRPAASHA